MKNRIAGREQAASLQERLKVTVDKQGEAPGKEYSKWSEDRTHYTVLIDKTQ